MCRLSELDEQRRAHLLQEVQRHEQVLLTATVPASLPPSMLAQTTENCHYMEF